MPKKNSSRAPRFAPEVRPFDRRPLALLLCALMLAPAAPRVASAQRRAATRVETEAQPRTSPESKKETERERRERAARRRARANDRGGGLRKIMPVRQSGAPQVGTPWTGEAGVQRTTASLMREQAQAQARQTAPRKPRMMPEREGPDRRWLPHNPESYNLKSTPNSVRRPAVRGAASAAAAEASAPQTVSSVNFIGATLSDTFAFPPDSMGAVGPAQFLVTVNGRVRSFNKTTGAADGVLNADTDAFFAPAMTPTTGVVNNNFTSDPRVRYDRLTKRWIVVMIDVPGTAGNVGDLPNRIMIAVSDAASQGVISASTVWTYYQFQQDTVLPAGDVGAFADYPTLGVDARALYIGCNMFDPNLGFTGTTAFVVRKSSIMSGGPVVVTAFRNLIDPLTGQGPYTPQGVDNYDAAANEGYFIGVDNATFGTLMLRRVTDPGGTPVMSANIPIDVADTSYPRLVPHQGNSVTGDADGDGQADGNLDALDDRLFAAHIRQGRLWTAHNIAVDTTGAAVNYSVVPSSRDGVRWYELGGIRSADNGGTPTVVQSGTLFDSAASSPRHFWIPSVMVSGQGHAAFGFSTAGSAARIDASTAGRLASDTAGALRTPPVQYTTSTTAYNPAGDPGGEFGRRWGDYSYTSLDPEDDMTMWTIQEYCQSANSYAVRVAKLLAPPPATPSSASVASVVAGQTNVTINITGTSASGAGFFDPGADFAKHVTATASNGVTVNSVTYTDPTHLTLSVNTTGATDGPVNVTVTNPDGQRATGSALFTVTGGAAPSGSPVLISEFRFRGAAGAADEFVELYNNTNSPLDISGYSVWALTGAGAQAVRFNVPGTLGSNTTVVPARGHYLLAGSAYSLAGVAASNGLLSTGIVDGSGVAVFAGATTAANRLDSVGFDTRDALFYEGTPLSPSSAAGAGGVTTSGEYSFVRKMSTATGGLPQDTNNNAADFAFVSPNGGTYTGRQATLGSPAPEGLASPVVRNSGFAMTLLDPSAGSASAPNRDRDFAPDPTNNSSFGTMTIRRTVTNNTGGNVTRLRFRVVDVTTFPAPDSATADLRLRTSSAATVAIVGANASCPSNSCAVEGLTLEAPSSASNGGLHATVSAGSIALATPLANGASVNVQFLLGVQQTGTFRFYVNVEALP